jgi:hypothetical protein
VSLLSYSLNQTTWGRIEMENLPYFFVKVCSG